MHYKELEVLADTIYGEARGEFPRPEGGLASLIAVGNVVVNRLLQGGDYGQSLTQVCQKPWQFSCWNANDNNKKILQALDRKENHLWKTCFQVAEKVASGIWPDLTKGSTHYYAQWLSQKPRWAEGQKVQAHIGQHLFFRI